MRQHLQGTIREGIRKTKVGLFIGKVKFSEKTDENILVQNFYSATASSKLCELIVAKASLSEKLQTFNSTD